MQPTTGLQPARPAGHGTADPTAALGRAVARYRDCGRFDRAYVAGKLRRDPVYAALLAESRNGFGRVLDVGCGRGQLGILLLEAGLATSVVGLDWNHAHLDQARRASSGLRLLAEHRDFAVAGGLPEADTVFLIDVLYQLDTQAQHALLDACVAAARFRVVIRTADPARGLRGLITQGLEVLGRRVWPHAGAHVNPMPVSALSDRLVAAGLEVTETACWSGTPFSNRLLVGRRAAP
jgi:SAM-dependent methyltransferase